MFVSIVTLLVVVLHCSCVSGRTRADDHRTHVADIRLLKGAFLGKVEYVQEALAHANTGNVNAVLTREIGEYFLKLGRAGVDFPVAPALHVAISGGTRRHLQVAHLLLMRGADPDLVYETKFKPFPATYFALGAFTAPTNAHAAILQKMFFSYPQKFNPYATRRFVEATGSPPPLHAAIMHNFFDGAYLLSTTNIYDVNEKDVQGLTALHVAAWLGNSNLILLLLHNHALPDILDPFRRSFFHYLACRGMSTILHALLSEDSSPLSFEMKLRLLALRDKSGHSALDIALIAPAQMRVVTEIVSFMKIANVSVPTLQYNYSPWQDTEKPVTLIRTEEDVLMSAATSQECDNGLAQWVVSNCSKYISRLSKRKAIPKIWNSVATREWSTLTEEGFKTDFFYPQRPLRLVGNFTSSMKIWKYLDMDIFLSRYGSLELNISDSYGLCKEDMGDLCKATFNEYFENSRRLENIDARATSPHLTCDMLGTHSLVGYMTVRRDDKIVEDVRLPQKFFSVCGLPSRSPLDGSLHLRVMSSTYAVTPFRSESAMWNVLLVGSIRHWYLVSPGAALNISSSGDRRFHSNGDFDKWVQNIFPELRKQRLAVEVVQNTGDVVFIPYSWSFVTLGQGDMIDLTHNFCVLPENASIFNQVPVGVRMYGHMAD